MHCISRLLSGFLVFLGGAAILVGCESITAPREPEVTLVAAFDPPILATRADQWPRIDLGARSFDFNDAVEEGQRIAEATLTAKIPFGAYQSNIRYSDGTHLFDDHAFATGAAYVFDRWDDGLTSKRRVIMITGDTTLTAHFKPVLSVKVNPPRVRQGGQDIFLSGRSQSNIRFSYVRHESVKDSWSQLYAELQGEARPLGVAEVKDNTYKLRWSAPEEVGRYRVLVESPARYRGVSAEFSVQGSSSVKTFVDRPGIKLGDSVELTGSIEPAIEQGTITLYWKELAARGWHTLVSLAAQDLPDRQRYSYLWSPAEPGLYEVYAVYTPRGLYFLSVSMSVRIEVRPSD